MISLTSMGTPLKPVMPAAARSTPTPLPRGKRKQMGCLSIAAAVATCSQARRLGAQGYSPQKQGAASWHENVSVTTSCGQAAGARAGNCTAEIAPSSLCNRTRWHENSICMELTM